MEKQSTPEEQYAIGSLGDDIDDVLKGMQTDGINSIKGIITDIEDLIEKRMELSAEIFQDLEKLKIVINTLLSGKEKDMTAGEIIEVKKKDIEVEEAKIREKLDRFKDILNLKRELRIHIADFNDKVNKMNMLDDLMKQ